MAKKEPPVRQKPQNIILEGVTGSKAYGLDHADSDEDIKGIYILPTEKNIEHEFQSR